MTTFTKGDEVRVTNINGSTVETHTEKKYQTIGQIGYVQKLYAGGEYVGVVLPETLHHSQGTGAALHRSEIELV